MKTIFQKHTSKFVAGLFNSLGITACVSLTSCGGENKVKQTENQGEELKNKLKTVDFYKSLAEDEGSLKTIADWLNSKNYGSDYILTAKDLQEIFQNDSKLNEVAEKLGVILTESDDEPDDEKKKEINEWLNKLNSLNDDVFNALDKDLKEKVAQKFIDNKMDVDNDSDIKAKLAGFINEVVVAKKESEISLKFEADGKAVITKVANNESTDFVFGEIKNLQSFVENLKDKEITKVEGELSFVFEGKNVKICSHESGFDITVCFDAFLNCLNTLVGVEKLKITKLSLKIEKGSLSLNDVACNDEFYKGSGFWNLVNKHADLFGITDENKFEIEKKRDKGSETVKINGFESSLKWSEVVKAEDKEFADNSGWDKIFKLKSKEESAKEVTVKFISKDKYSIADGDEVDLKDFNTLKNFVDSVKDKTVTVDEDKKFEFSVKDGKTISVKVEKLVDFDVVINGENFSALLGCVGDLEKVGLVENGFKFTVEADSTKSVIKFGETGVKDEFLVSKEAWEIIKDKKDLFNFNGGIKVSKSGESNKQVKVGDLVLNFDVLDGAGNGKESKFSDTWKNVFTLGN